MRVFNLILLVALTSCVAYNPSPSQKIQDEVEITYKWQKFIRTYNKTYSSAEYQNRRAIFADNLFRVRAMNEKSLRSKPYGMTKFSDLTPEEFKNQYLMNVVTRSSRDTSRTLELPDAPLPTSFDWRSKGAVTPTYDQGQCGSCWAFSATEAIESAWFLAGHTLTSLSPQQIVDCDLNNGDEGCNGGDTPTAYEYVIKAGGMDTMAAYPYTAEDDTCAFNRSGIAASIKNWAYITQNSNETQMQVGLVSKGPLSICVDAASWQFYYEGVITDLCGNSLDHCVMITGYGTFTDALDLTYDVWNVRNSWGADWGYGGYLYVERGYDLCGIADEVTIPLVN
eukprot:TRINITY_DN21751_c0_g1_i1.p1 TRINITY_DN21751_c0_g1~~TRINITY_DN21751_c0_g1_i1.p1  ORF type:complete len:338 (+),score=51.52 TRINITY_DN21751_c0_g1_i1:18-1031(+)